MPEPEQEPIKQEAAQGAAGQPVNVPADILEKLTNQLASLEKAVREGADRARPDAFSPDYMRSVAQPGREQPPPQGEEEEAKRGFTEEQLEAMSWRERMQLMSEIVQERIDRAEEARQVAATGTRLASERRELERTHPDFREVLPKMREIAGEFADNASLLTVYRTAKMIIEAEKAEKTPPPPPPKTPEERLSEVRRGGRVERPGPVQPPGAVAESGKTIKEAAESALEEVLASGGTLSP